MLLVFFIVLSVVAGSLILRCRSAPQWRPCPLLYPVVSSASSEPIRAGLSGWCQSPVSACLLHWYCKQGAFVPLTLLSIFTTTPPSAIHNNRLSPSRGVVVRLPDGHRYGPPLLHDRSIVMRAVTTTPVDYLYARRWREQAKAIRKYRRAYIHIFLSVISYSFIHLNWYHVVFNYSHVCCQVKH